MKMHCEDEDKYFMFINFTDFGSSTEYSSPNYRS